MEKYMLVEKKKDLASKALLGLTVLLTVLMLLLTVILGSVSIVFACIFGFLAFSIARRFVEFEYSYFEGEVRFAKVINKSRRKSIVSYQMDEVVIIAPAGDRSVYNYENDSTFKVRNLTSGDKDTKVYIMVVKGEKGMELVRFEPDEEILGEICKKYTHKVKR